MDWADAPARALVVRRPRPQRVKGTPQGSATGSRQPEQYALSSGCGQIPAVAPSGWREEPGDLRFREHVER
ncbi:hypothetical protein D2E80_07140 [Mycobacteroides abscessus]|nr:hypothetical protein D2E80_07140 [Mycobacteroides abscessus]